MALEVGSRIAHYDVTALIGEGGMGRVYQATDTKLNRQVALKVLPEAFAADPDRLARFQREAQVLASLNHPGIAAIYGIEEDDDTGALVLELVGGPTLADRIARGPVPVDEALPIAKQIAEALEAAHEAGVIHRDLKPANIKVRDDGTVKVLDFGLAKAAAPAPEGDPDQSPTLTAAATRMGVIMGTAAYMSPEQAVGKPVDKRGDIWSFGVVLFEMLTGRRPFSGETVSHVLASVLKTDPDWTRLPTSTPQPLTRLLKRCLERESTQRLRDIGDARLEISAAAVPSGSVRDRPEQPGGHTKTDTYRIVTVGVVCILVGFAFAAFVLSDAVVPSTLETESTARPLSRLTINLPEHALLASPQATPFGYLRPSFKLSPDGSELVYVAERGDTTQLYRRRLAAFDVVPIPGTEGAYDPFYSPDGERIAFFTVEQLKVVSRSGGAPETIVDVNTPMGGVWSDHGMIYVADNEGLTLSVVSVDTRQITAQHSPSYPTGFEHPESLPGGAGILYSSFVSFDKLSGDAADITLLSPGDANVRRVVSARGFSPRYSLTGHLLFARSGGIMAVPFDAERGEATGDPVSVLTGVSMNSVNSKTAQFDLSQTGTLAYVEGSDVGVTVPLWVDLEGSPSRIPISPEAFGTFDLSPDGTRLVIEVAGVTDDVRVYDLATGRPTRMAQEGNNGKPVWSDDGTRVYFASDRSGSHGLFSQIVDAATGAEPFLDAVEIVVAPKGGGAAYVEVAGDERILRVGDIDQLQDAQVVEDALGLNSFSPDGRWLAYTTRRSGQYEVVVREYPLADRVWSISSGYGEEPIWAPDGTAIYYRRHGEWMSVPILATDAGGDEFVTGAPVPLFRGAFQNPYGLSYDIDPVSGDRFLMLQSESGAPRRDQINIILNFAEELTDRVPVR